MPSQRIGKIIEEQSAARAIRVDTTFTSTSRDGARPQHYSTDQELDIMDTRLYDACETIETSRKKLYDSRVAIATFEQALKQERQSRLESSQAYKVLHIQHGNTLTDLNNMANKCLSLHRELEEAQQTIHSYESTMVEYEDGLSSRTTSGNIKDHEMDQAGWDMLDPTVVKTEQLEVRIIGLEKEKENMIREHENALINAANRICAAERKIDEVFQEKADMMQEHQSALTNATNRIYATEQKNDELEKMLHTSKPQESSHIDSTASPGQVLSPTAGKRQRPEDDQGANTQRQGGSAQKNRKRRQVTKAKVSNTIVG